MVQKASLRKYVFQKLCPKENLWYRNFVLNQKRLKELFAFQLHIYEVLDTQGEVILQIVNNTVTGFRLKQLIVKKLLSAVFEGCKL